MTLDSSALIAILFAEPGYLALVDRILEADHVRVGAPTLVESSLVFAGRKGARSAPLRRGGMASGRGRVSPLRPRTPQRRTELRRLPGVCHGVSTYYCNTAILRP